MRSTVLQTQDCFFIVSSVGTNWLGRHGLEVCLSSLRMCATDDLFPQVESGVSGRHAGAGPMTPESRSSDTSGARWVRPLVDGAGLAAVLAGLVFVALEIRQNTAAVRAATQQAVFEAGLQAHWGVMENERLREVMVRARDDPAWAMTLPQTPDHILLERFYQQRFNGLENAYYHHLKGTLDPGLWAGWEGWLQSIKEDPVMVFFWARLRDGYMPDLVEYMDATLGKPASP